jgi:hypothetical protein
MPDVQENEQKGSDANGQSDDIDRRVVSMFKKVSESAPEIVPQHGRTFL